MLGLGKLLLFTAYYCTIAWASRRRVNRSWRREQADSP